MARLQRARGIIRAGGLDADHAHVGLDVFCRHGDAAELPAAAHRTENHIESGHILEQLDGGGSLPRHDAQIVIGMNEHGTGSLHHLLGRVDSRAANVGSHRTTSPP